MKRIQSLLSRQEPAKWLFYGDSITHGAAHTFGARDYTEHFTERVRTEMGRTQDIVIKTAISGNTTRDLLATFDWRVASLHPDVVFLMIGMNDCSTVRNLPLEEFQENLIKLADQIEAVGSQLVLQTTCPILPGTARDREENFSAYMQAIRDLAESRSLPLIDHEIYWRQFPAKHFYWMSNAFHPNGVGHLAFAHELFRQLNIFDEKAATCRLFVP